MVTADKGPVLLAFDELTELAKSRRVQFAAGCTAGGALPAVNGGMADMAGARIKTIEGIFNGTSNYILDRMEPRRDKFAGGPRRCRQVRDRRG